MKSICRFEQLNLIAGFVEKGMMNMKFLMIYPNSTGASRVPLGIVYLLTILKEQGHDVRLFDMTFYGVNVDNNYVDVRSSK